MKYRPKHLKKSRYSLYSGVLSAVAIIMLLIIFLLHVVPVSGNAEDIQPDATISALNETSTPQRVISWIPTPVPFFVVTFVICEEPLEALPEAQPELDLSVTRGTLYSAAHLDEWEEIASTEEIPQAEEVLQLIADCRALLAYECYRGETLVQALAKTVTAEIGGLEDYTSFSTARMEEAAVVWCVLNRVDTNYEDGKAEHVKKTVKAKKQFAYHSNYVIHDGMEEIVTDVLIRWQLEKSGLLEDCGRVLPVEYQYFNGDGRHNYFRIKYRDYKYWDWPLPDPYKEG